MIRIAKRQVVKMPTCHGTCSCLKLNTSRYRNSPVFCGSWNFFCDLFTSLTFWIALVITISTIVHQFILSKACDTNMNRTEDVEPSWNSLSIPFDAKKILTHPMLSFTRDSRFGPEPCVSGNRAKKPIPEILPDLPPNH